MKKLVLFIIITALLFNIPANAKEKEFIIPEVKAYVLIEAETGEILFSHNENEQLPISSLAQLMLLLIINEELKAGNISLTDNIPAPASVIGTKGSVIWLDPGEIMTAGELVKAVIISSSNDAAVTLAEFINHDFAARMNEKAKELGMNDTFFADVGGFTQETVSTARDAAIMTAALFKHDNELNELYTTWLCSVRTGMERETQLVNTNKLARWYEGILGGKAGHSPFAGLCLANCAERGNMKLAAVVLGAKNENDRVNLCEYLLDKGFDGFEYVTPEVDTSKFSPVKVMRGVAKDVLAAPNCAMTFIAPKGQGGNAKFEFTLPEYITAPVEAGQVIGTVTVRLGEKIVAECDIITLHAVEKLTFGKSLEIITESLFNNGGKST